MKYKIVLTASFRKELKLIKKRRKDLKKLSIVVNTLASGFKLDDKYRDHALICSTRFKNCRECHIEPDWLLVYKQSDTDLILFLIETGTHSDLF